MGYVKREISCRELAKKYGINRNSVTRTVYCKKNATKEQLDMLRAGKISLNKVYTDLKNKTKEALNCQKQM